MATNASGGLRLDEHDLIKAMKELALELGMTPTRRQFLDHTRYTASQVEKLFGNFTKLQTASDLVPNKERITNKIFEKDIDKHLEEYVPKDLPPDEPLARGAFISDIHWPFCNQKVIDKYYRYIEREKPEWAVLVGDAWDMYSHAKFPRSHNLFTPREEEERARKSNEEFWREVKKAHPEIKCVQMLGNHDVRPMKRTMEVLPTMEHHLEKIFKELFTFEGVDTIMDVRQELHLPGVMVHHGHFTKLGDHRDYALRNTIVGHTHVAGIVFRRLYGRTIFEMNNGLAGDPNAKGLSYTPQKVTKWTPSFSATEEDGPRVILC